MLCPINVASVSRPLFLIWGISALIGSYVEGEITVVIVIAHIVPREGLFSVNLHTVKGVGRGFHVALAQNCHLIDYIDFFPFINVNSCKYYQIFCT